MSKCVGQEVLKMDVRFPQILSGDPPFGSLWRDPRAQAAEWSWTNFGHCNFSSFFICRLGLSQRLKTPSRRHWRLCLRGSSSWPALVPQSWPHFWSLLGMSVKPAHPSFLASSHRPYLVPLYCLNPDTCVFCPILNLHNRRTVAYHVALWLQ